MIQRRVRDKHSGDLGTAVDRRSDRKYRIEWDEPTPYQDRAWVHIPNEYFEWADGAE